MPALLHPPSSGQHLQHFTSTEHRMSDEEDDDENATDTTTDNDSNASQEEVVANNSPLFLYDPNDPYDERFFHDHDEDMGEIDTNITHHILQGDDAYRNSDVGAPYGKLFLNSVKTICC
jgi:hypothetical protein